MTVNVGSGSKNIVYPTLNIFLGNPRFNVTVQAVGKSEDMQEAQWRETIKQHGPLGPAHVSGDFAVAMRDGDGRVFMATDRFGIRPMCYRIVGNELYFAERADALADIRPEIDPQAIFDYLYFHVIPSPRTIYKGVCRLPPGHYALFENGQLTVAPYWKPVFSEEKSSFSERRDEFVQILRDSVQDQLNGREVGCFLSGGTDSSTVAGLLGEVSGKPARTFSIGFDADGYDEMAYSRLAARHFKAEHHEYYITPDDLVCSIPDVASSYDQPFGNASVLPAYYCAKMARESGVNLLLGGDGGDELFGGNTRYAKQRIFGAYEMIPLPLRSGLFEPFMLGNPALAKIPGIKKVVSYVDQARVPLPDRMQTYNLLTRLGLNNVLTSDFLARVDIELPLSQERQVFAACNADSLVNKMLAFDWRYTLADSDLPKVLGATSLAGVEVGFPLLDNRLVDFSLKLPASYKVKGLKLRWFFKEALRGFLPDEILIKKKQGFGLPFGVWANQHEPLKQLATGSLRNLSARGVVRPDFVESLLKEHLPAFPGYYGVMVWVLMMLEQWLEAKAPAWRLGDE
jgi:asparagine synthase (glutamine-hydrolysing)